MELYPRALKKYDLEKRCGLARETVRDWFPRMQRYRWVIGRAAGKSNAGKSMIEYTLTDLGCFQAACLNPTLRPRVKRLLGTNYREIEEARAARGGRLMKNYFESWLPTITRAIITGKEQPGFYYCLELIADKNGKLHLGKRSKVGIVPSW